MPRAVRKSSDYSSRRANPKPGSQTVPRYLREQKTTEVSTSSSGKKRGVVTTTSASRKAIRSAPTKRVPTPPSRLQEETPKSAYQNPSLRIHYCRVCSKIFKPGDDAFKPPPGAPRGSMTPHALVRQHQRLLSHKGKPEHTYLGKELELECSRYCISLEQPEEKEFGYCMYGSGFTKKRRTPEEQRRSLELLNSLFPE